MLNLPDVTLVISDGVCNVLSHLAVRDCKSVVQFGGEIIDISERPNSTRDRWCDWIWYEIPYLVQTSHFLVIQWDGWILHPELWDTGWLSYDYMGAPWPLDYEAAPGLVGNGGFSLRSKRLALEVANNREHYPMIRSSLDNAPSEDIALSRYYREALEATGLKWANYEDAQRFSFEMIPPEGPTFGFHGSENITRAIKSKIKYYERWKAIKYTPYLQSEAWYKVMSLPHA